MYASSVWFPRLWNCTWFEVSKTSKASLCSLDVQVLPIASSRCSRDAGALANWFRTPVVHWFTKATLWLHHFLSPASKNFIIHQSDPQKLQVWPIFKTIRWCGGSEIHFLTFPDLRPMSIQGIVAEPVLNVLRPGTQQLETANGVWGPKENDDWMVRYVCHYRYKYAICNCRK